MIRLFFLFIVLSTAVFFTNAQTSSTFPDGSPLTEWFTNNPKLDKSELGTPYIITKHGAKNDSTLLQTQVIQKCIDEASEQGGGVIIIPNGTFLSGALFFKPGTHLHLEEGAVLKGSDNIENFPQIPSRMEGQSLEYFSALINVYSVDGFSITGKGTIDGNGLKYWEAFWQRRKENPKCTNLEISRPRLVFVWNCKNVQFQDVKMKNSGFWTNHFYQCENVKLLDLSITSPHSPVKAPSTDAIDLDICKNVIIKGCYLSVNDDAIALKGGKGPMADQIPYNGSNHNILIEDCSFGFCHSALTNGSESIHNRNIWMRNCKVDGPYRLLWFKMRPDTPQNYEYVTLENIEGNVNKFLHIYSWKQFFDLKGRSTMPQSKASHVIMKNIDIQCTSFFTVREDKNIEISDFHFENLKIQAEDPDPHKNLVENFSLKNVEVNEKIID